MPDYGAREMANAFRTVRGNTIRIAEEIPEDRYDFAAAPGVRSVSETLRHIIFANLLHYDFHRERRLTTLVGYDFGAIVGRMNGEAAKPRDKAGIVALLRDEGEKFAQWLESLSPALLAETFTDPAGQNPKTRLEHLLGAKEHEMHHRGQLMLVERMLGITPHLTRQLEERRARAASTATQGSGAPAASTLTV